MADPIRIDYKKVNSANIMKQIKEAVSQKNKPSENEKGNVMKSVFKTIFSKLARPFRPFIRVLIQDAHQDLMIETYDRLRRLEQEEGDQRKKEYIKLLYGLSHNIVVELTKLKIEVEDLRVKLSILEKEFENFKKRERALEKRLIK